MCSPIFFSYTKACELIIVICITSRVFSFHFISFLFYAGLLSGIVCLFVCKI